jgi:hypothetical protein
LKKNVKRFGQRTKTQPKEKFLLFSKKKKRKKSKKKRKSHKTKERKKIFVNFQKKNYIELLRFENP